MIIPPMGYPSSCSGYSTGRLVSYVSALLSRLKNSDNPNTTCRMCFITQTHPIKAILSPSDRIQNGYLHTRTESSPVSVKLSEVSSIELDPPYYIGGGTHLGQPPVSAILRMANIEPPDECTDYLLLSHGLINKLGGAVTIDTPSRTYTDINPLSVAEGIALFQASDCCVLIPYHFIDNWY